MTSLSLATDADLSPAAAWSQRVRKRGRFHPARLRRLLADPRRAQHRRRNRDRPAKHIVGLTDAAHRRAGKLSLGMGQRLGIAAVLLRGLLDLPGAAGTRGTPACPSPTPASCAPSSAERSTSCSSAPSQLALGALIRRTAGAVAVLFAVLLVVPGLVTLLPAPWNNDITRYLPNSAGAAMSAVARFPNLLSPAEGLLVLCGYAAAALIFAAAALNRRDA